MEQEQIEDEWVAKAKAQINHDDDPTGIAHMSQAATKVHGEWDLRGAFKTRYLHSAACSSHATSGLP